MHEYLDDYFTGIDPTISELVQDAILPYFCECETCGKVRECGNDMIDGRTLPVCMDAIVMLGWLAAFALDAPATKPETHNGEYAGVQRREVFEHEHEHVSINGDRYSVWKAHTLLSLTSYERHRFIDENGDVFVADGAGAYRASSGAGVYYDLPRG
ncbi:MAG: hypothetical protein RBS17_07505 [Coriobacteriia bacterium]|nr:hypothetical protein [Coriobacteriia bacterium]